MSEKTKHFEENPVLPPENDTVDKAMPFYKIWLLAFLKPGEKTYIDITNQPNISIQRTFLWVSVVALFIGMISAKSTVNSLRPLLPQEFVHAFFPYNPYAPLPPLLSFSVTFIVALTMIATFFAAVYLLLWLVKALGGETSFDKLSYVLAAIFIPYEITRQIWLHVIAWLVYKSPIWILSVVRVPPFVLKIYAIVIAGFAIKTVFFNGKAKPKFSHPMNFANSFLYQSFLSFFVPKEETYQKIALQPKTSFTKAALWFTAFFMATNLLLWFDVRHILVLAPYAFGTFSLIVSLTQRKAKALGGDGNKDGTARVLATITIAVAIVGFLLTRPFFVPLHYDWVPGSFSSGISQSENPFLFSLILNLRVLPYFVVPYLLVLFGLGVAGANKLRGREKIIMVVYTGVIVFVFIILIPAIVYLFLSLQFLV